jgi:hypothetical protein
LASHTCLNTKSLVNQVDKIQIRKHILQPKQITRMNPFKNTLLLFCIIACGHAAAQNNLHKPGKLKTENLVMVALDGMRWQEIFGGIDSSIVRNELYTKDAKAINKLFAAIDPSERRKKLLPFFWTNIAAHGQLYGNRAFGNKVDVANPYKLTYPGFSETVTGNPDTSIHSNRLIKNNNINVFEFLNRQKGYTGRIATFATSELFPFVLNKWRNGLIVNADTDSLPYNTPEMRMLNDMGKLAAKPTTERPDLLTYFAAREYLKVYHPKVLYIAMGETDAFAHDGLYDQYLGAVHAEDAMIADLWNRLQSMPQYKNKTTLIITCDHGRGDKIKGQWTDHGPTVEDSGNIWFAVMGPDTTPLGEVTEPMQLYQGQLAATMARFLGFHFTAPQKILPPIDEVLH